MEIFQNLHGLRKITQAKFLENLLARYFGSASQGRGRQTTACGPDLFLPEPMN